MKKYGLRLCGLVAACVLLLGCAACKQPTDLSVSVDETPTTTATPTTTGPQGALNLLTGERLNGNDNRPIAFMIGNVAYSATIQQKNIDKADFYVEAETEGGISRIMAVFGSVENLPDEIGPVRSARTHFVKMVKALDAMYCHVGGSTKAKSLIPSLKIADLDSVGMQISNELKAVNGWGVEHHKVSKIEKVLSTISSRGYNKASTKQAPYQFGDKSGDGAGAAVQVSTSTSWATSFTYDAATGLYTKHRKGLPTDIHKAYGGNPIQVKNVIVMYDERYQEDEGHISFTLNSGDGLLVSGGTSRAIKWKRTNDQLTYTEADGTPLTVAVGKTFVVLTSKALASKTILQ